MKTIEELLKNLARPEVQEFGLVTNRLPSVNIGGKFEPVDDEAPGNERLMQMLVTMGGGRHVDDLGEKPVQWSTRVEGIGVIAVACIQRKDVIQARFTVMKREGGSLRPPSEKGQQVARPITPAVATRPSGPPAAPRVAERASREPPPVKPSSAPKVSVKPPVPTRTVPSALPVSPSPEPSASEIPWLDEGEDNEPTLQTQARAVVAAALKAPPIGVPTGTPEIPTAIPSIPPMSVPPSAAAAAAAALEERRPAKPGSSAKLRVAQTSPDLAKVAAAVAMQNHGAEAAKARAAVTLQSVAEKDRSRVDPAGSLESFLAMAVSARASDLFLVGDRPVMLRIAGELVARTEPIPADQVERFVKDILPARLRETFERDGECTFAHDTPAQGRFRANASRHRTGSKINLRVVARELPRPSALGISETVFEGLRVASGLVLVSGPPGQGKSTTLAAMVDDLNRETTRHVMTLEEPIEWVHVRRKSLVSQREVGAHGTRARLLETALRSDADVLVLGEIVDAETARDALLAADGGRLVLTTINAPSATRALARVLDLVPAGDEAWARQRLASALRLVTGQRLVPSSDRTQTHVAVELLPGSSTVFGMIRQRRFDDLADLHRRGSAPGAVRLEESLAELARTQKVQLDVAKKQAEHPTDIDGYIAERIGSTPAVSVKRA